MRDVIVYCPSTPALIAALREGHPKRLSEDLPLSAVRYLAGLRHRTEAERRDAEDRAWRVARKEGSVRASFLIDKTPTKRRGEETLALVRVVDRATGDMLSSLEAAKAIEVLGTWAEVQADSRMRKIYDRVYPRKPVTYTDEDGTERTTTPPEEIGRFA